MTSVFHYHFASSGDLLSFLLSREICHLTNFRLYSELVYSRRDGLPNAVESVRKPCLPRSEG